MAWNQIYDPMGNWNSDDAIVDACCEAWNRLMNMPQRLASIARRTWV